MLLGKFSLLLQFQHILRVDQGCHLNINILCHAVGFRRHHVGDRYPRHDAIPRRPEPWDLWLPSWRTETEAARRLFGWAVSVVSSWHWCLGCVGGATFDSVWRHHIWTTLNKCSALFTLKGLKFFVVKMLSLVCIWVADVEYLPVSVHLNLAHMLILLTTIICLEIESWSCNLQSYL